MKRDWRAAIALLAIVIAAFMTSYYLKAITLLMQMGPDLQSARYNWTKPIECTQIPEGMAVMWSLDSGCVGYVPTWSLYGALALILLSVGLLIWIWWKPNK